MGRSVWQPFASCAAVLSVAAFALWLGAATAIAQANPKADEPRPQQRGASGALEEAFRLVQALSLPDAALLAAQGTPEGHWRFVNRSGEMFTVGTPDEMKRVVTVLYPDIKPGTRLALYMTEDTVTGKGVRFRALPAGAERHIVVGEKKSYPLLPAEEEPRYAQVRPHVGVEVQGNALLKEALDRLAEPLGKAGVRVLALEPGGPETLPQDPPADPAKAAQGEPVDPEKLAAALARLPAGRTVVVCARGDGDLIYVRESGRPVGELIAAAEGARVALIVLQFAWTPQPSTAGAAACRHDGRPAPELTLADILEAAVAESRKAPVAVGLAGGLRVLDAIVIGELANGTRIRLGDSRQRRLGRSYLPDIDLPWAALYVGFLMLGWLGTPVARNWWAKVWNPGDPGEYQGRAGYWAARAVSFLVFALVFQPITAIVTAPRNLAPQVRDAIMGPVRAWRWITRRGAGTKAAAAGG